MTLLLLILKNGLTLSYPLDNSDIWLSPLTKASILMKKPGPGTSEERLLDSSIDLTLLFKLSSHILLLLSLSLTFNLQNFNAIEYDISK